MTIIEATRAYDAVRDALQGAEAARLIWDDDEAAEMIVDPRTPAFARAMIDTSVSILRSSRGLIKKMIDRAAAGAEDLAVAQFQGIIEVIQNADDVRATEVRFALRETAAGRQLLIVHNGEPVVCQNVLGMALPYLTTKTERVDQRGRFGIGLKTLKRIADSIAIHSAPYHFSGDQLLFDWVEPEPALPGFFDPAVDTMLVVGLNDNFDEDELREWFEAWQDEGLLFLTHVGRFRWCALDGTTIAERALTFSDWSDAGYKTPHNGVLRLRSRRVEGPADSWTVWRATLQVPPRLHPAHKARSETTDISIALADGDTRPALYIGFKSHVPIALGFSLDAHFDPNTSREAIIENPWNNWLIDRVADVVGDIAAGLLATSPRVGWTLVPLADEHVGKEDDPWVKTRFSAAFETMRDWLKGSGSIVLNGHLVPFPKTAYEYEDLSGLLSALDVERMVPNARAVGEDARDDAGRWRGVLDTLGVSATVGMEALLDALEALTFEDKTPGWWVDAAARLVAVHPDQELFGRSFLLSDDHRPIACAEMDETDRPLVFDAAPSSFATRWKLLERLHPAYGEGDSGKQVIGWLTANAAFTSHLDAAIELAAFAEHFSGTTIEVTDEELRDLRARFDGVSDRIAEDLGPKVGAVLALDGHVFKGDKVVRQKVALAQAYLCKTLDGENATWPDAAGTTPRIQWISSKYETVLKTDAGRWAKRRREDGIVSRGPRRFLTLLGAEVAPRVVQTEGLVRWGSDLRIAELRKKGAEQVEYDYVSPDLSRALKGLQKLVKRDAKIRAPALLRTLARNWDRLYANRQLVPAEHVAIKYTYGRGEVTAGWLNELKETPWIAVGRGELALPEVAVVRTPETQALYEVFACEVARDDIHDGLASALQLITDVRIGDLVDRLGQLRGGVVVDESYVLQIYRTIAKRCPRVANYNTRIGELTAQDLRRRFLEGGGLIYVGDGIWRRPDQVMRGMDIFHDKSLFVPGGAACANLWMVLDVSEPGLDECIRFCRDLAQAPYSDATDAALMDVYRYMERVIGTTERKHRDKLRALPLACSGRWVSTRPIYYVDSPELRDQLIASGGLNCWTPPCDVRDFPRLVELLLVEILDPDLSVEDDPEEAIDRGEQTRLRYGHAVDHLSAELARSEPATRDKISGSWDQLKAMPLFVYQHEINVRATGPALPPAGVRVALKALVRGRPAEFHLREDDIGDRDFGGRAVATLFPPDVRRRIDGEWQLAWQKSRDTAAAAIRLASDEKRTEAMQEAAAAINATPKGKIKVTAPASRSSNAKPRTLKESVGAVVGATIHGGTTPTKSNKPKSGSGLKPTPPEPGKGGGGSPATPTAYTNMDLEQRGWEILVQALETSPDQRLVDFRQTHGVGADGVFDWKRFVEMKATARGPQTQVELSNNEFDRAKERGSDFILALVSGLETGQRDEVRLIFDPANCATVRPTNGVKLVSLLEAPAVIIHFADAEIEE